MMKYILLALAVTATISAQSIDDMEIEDEAPCTIQACRNLCRTVTSYKTVWVSSKGRRLLSTETEPNVDSNAAIDRNIDDAMTADLDSGANAESKAKLYGRRRRWVVKVFHRHHRHAPHKHVPKKVAVHTKVCDVKNVKCLAANDACNKKMAALRHALAAADKAEAAALAKANAAAAAAKKAGAHSAAAKAAHDAAAKAKAAAAKAAAAAAAAEKTSAAGVRAAMAASQKASQAAASAAIAAASAAKAEKTAIAAAHAQIAEAKGKTSAANKAAAAAK